MLVKRNVHADTKNLSPRLLKYSASACLQGERLKQKIGDIVLKGGDVLLLDTGQCWYGIAECNFRVTAHG